MDNETFTNFADLWKYCEAQAIDGLGKRFNGSDAATYWDHMAIWARGAVEAQIQPDLALALEAHSLAKRLWMADGNPTWISDAGKARRIALSVHRIKLCQGMLTANGLKLPGPSARYIEIVLNHAEALKPSVS